MMIDELVEFKTCLHNGLELFPELLRSRAVFERHVQDVVTRVRFTSAWVEVLAHSMNRAKQEVVVITEKLFGTIAYFFHPPIWEY